MKARTLPCEHCGGVTAREAKTCPHCGGKLYRTSDLTKVIGWIVGIGMVLFILGLFSSLK